MCGIIGMIGDAREGQWGQTYRLLRELFLAVEHRGHDATGFVAATEPLKAPLDGCAIVSKAPQTASRFINSDKVFRRLAHQRCNAFVGHVRAATHGDPADNRNNHPHCGTGLYLVHNGIAANYAEIMDKYSVQITSQCDSEVLLHLLEQAEHPLYGLRLCLSEVDGSMAVAVYDRPRGCVYLARNGGRPLWLARLKGERRWWFASTRAILLSTFDKVLGSNSVARCDYLAPVPEDCPLVIGLDGYVLAPLGSD